MPVFNFEGSTFQRRSPRQKTIPKSPVAKATNAIFRAEKKFTAKSPSAARKARGSSQLRTPMSLHRRRPKQDHWRSPDIRSIGSKPDTPQVCSTGGCKTKKDKRRDSSLECVNETPLLLNECLLDSMPEEPNNETMDIVLGKTPKATPEKHQKENARPKGNTPGGSKSGKKLIMSSRKNPASHRTAPKKVRIVDSKIPSRAKDVRFAKTPKRVVQNPRTPQSKKLSLQAASLLSSRTPAVLKPDKRTNATPRAPPPTPGSPTRSPILCVDSPEVIFCTPSSKIRRSSRIQTSNSHTKK